MPKTLRTAAFAAAIIYGLVTFAYGWALSMVPEPGATAREYLNAFTSGNILEVCRLDAHMDFEFRELLAALSLPPESYRLAHKNPDMTAKYCGQTFTPEGRRAVDGNYLARAASVAELRNAGAGAGLSPALARARALSSGTQAWREQSALFRLEYTDPQNRPDYVPNPKRPHVTRGKVLSAEIVLMVRLPRQVSGMITTATMIVYFLQPYSSWFPLVRHIPRPGTGESPWRIEPLMETLTTTPVQRDPPSGEAGDGDD